MTRPDPSEHAPYFSRYINLVTEEDVVTGLELQRQEIAGLLAGVTEKRAAFRYAPSKWSVKEVVTHITDAERVFTYRALSIARGETRSLPGFDENVFAQNAGADRRPLREIGAEFDAVRTASIALFRGLPDEAWKRIGTANESQISVRALAYVALGHARHHVDILRERYL